jgi:3-dehydroquinate synthase
MSESISVETSTQNKYELRFGLGLTEELRAFIRKYSPDKAFVMVDENVNRHHRAYFEDVLNSRFAHVHVFEVPSGESSKSVQLFAKAVDFVLQTGVERGTPLFAIGGGVTGDLSGFVAATVLRGIPLVHIPTTLLAMVDSSIGGKTGINHQVGKNLVGSFYQPEAVFADVKFLETLAEKEWINGLSEVLKYGMIHSPEILQQVTQLRESERLFEGEAWLPLIQKSAQIKTDIVAEDVLEAGKRAFLNFGHTFAHVIEHEGSYVQYSHGEAVFAGMIAAVHASNCLGASIHESNLLEFKPLYELSLSDISAAPAELVEGMKADKKVKNEQIRLILLKKPGAPYLYEVDETDFVESAWRYTLNIFQ